MLIIGPYQILVNTASFLGNGSNYAHASFKRLVAPAHVAPEITDTQLGDFDLIESPRELPAQQTKLALVIR